MKDLFHDLKVLLGRIHRSEQGAEAVEKLLIIGAIVIPLLGLLIVLRNKLSEWLSGKWETTTQEADTAVTTPN
ncbi:MAG: hypothetical protein NTW19_12540 [Planctomycetota bacterium]|nr:hypothetical protein [Planctomycetota bacterium]